MMSCLVLLVWPSGPVSFSRGSRSLPVANFDYNQLATAFAKYRQVHPTVVDALVATGGVDKDSPVLEVGCGTGNYIIAMRTATACPSWGVEPAEEMLGQARQRSTEVNWKLGRAEQLEFPDQTFQFVFSIDVIHHLNNPASYFREAYRVLKAGGKICTVTDSVSTIRHRRPLAEYFPETVEADIRRYPALSELRRGMEQAGFREIREQLVEWSVQLEDIGRYRHKAFSVLHLIPEEAFQRGMARLEDDLRKGPIPAQSQYVMIWGKRGNVDPSTLLRRQS